MTDGHEAHIHAQDRAQGDVRITYVGHATSLIEMDGLRILTDPILRNRVAFLRRRQKNKISAELYDSVDAILLSHLHHDHLDPPSLRLAGVQVPVIAPLGSAEYLTKRGMQNVEEMKVGDKITMGSITVRATYADHNPQRHPFGLSANCLGFVIEGEFSIYFAGDTDLFPGMESLADDLDVALLPVWGWGPSLGAGHMNPQSAAQALRLLRPRLSIPIHWGAFYPTGLGLFRSDYLHFPPRRFAEYAEQLAPEVMVRIVEPGHSLSLREVFA